MREASEQQKMEAAIEAILFATGRAVPTEDIGRALELDRDEALELVSNLAEHWNAEERGTEIIELDGCWQMCTRRAYYPELIRLELTPKKIRLTDVALETLSVIAYKQPVTKAEIERIRGVNSDHAVNKLIEYKLVTELGRAKQPGRPILFGTTQEFLRVFGISSRDNLPEISPVQVEDFRQEAESEAGIIREDKAEQQDGSADGEAAVEAAGTDTTENSADHARAGGDTDESPDAESGIPDERPGAESGISDERVGAESGISDESPSLESGIPDERPGIGNAAHEERLSIENGIPDERTIADEINRDDMSGTIIGI